MNMRHYIVKNSDKIKRVKKIKSIKKDKFIFINTGNNSFIKVDAKKYVKICDIVKVIIKYRIQELWDIDGWVTIKKELLQLTNPESIIKAVCETHMRYECLKNLTATPTIKYKIDRLKIIFNNGKTKTMKIDDFIAKYL